MLTSTENATDLVPRINVVCQGTPWAMGEAQGAALTEKIHHLREDLSTLEAFRLKQPSWLPFRLYRNLAEKKATQYLAKALVNSPVHVERMMGLVAGSRLPMRSLSLFQAMEPTLATPDRESAHAVASACSVVGVRGPRSAKGKTILARNFDYLKLVQPYYILRRDEPTGRFRSLIFTTAPLIGAVDGINECGLCITYNYAVAIDSARPAPTISMHIAEALANCRTVKEAAAWIGGAARWGSGILMLADDTGDLAALELSHTRCQLRRIPETEDAPLSFQRLPITCDAIRPSVPKRSLERARSDAITRDTHPRICGTPGCPLPRTAVPARLFRPGRSRPDDGRSRSRRLAQR